MTAWRDISTAPKDGETGTTRDGLFAQILDLTKRWNEYEDIPVSQRHECRQIGRKLNEIGGKQLMVEAYYAAKAQNNAVTVIQAYWDGIGDWRW